MVWAMKKVAVSSILLGVVLLAVAVIAEAQQPKKVFRIGLLSGNRSSPMPPQIEALRQGLRELGYVEGQNIHFPNFHEWPFFTMAVRGEIKRS